MSNNGHQDILKYFKFVFFFVGRILGKQKNLFNINKLQEIFYPLGDANRHLKAHHIPPKLRFCGAPFVLSRPCKALPPGPQAAPLSPAPPRPAAFWKKLPLRPKTPSPSCSRRNLRHEDGAFIRQAYGLRAALFFPAHRMYAPPLAAPKGPSARFESAS